MIALVQLVLEYLDWILVCLWILAICVYAMKLVIPDWDLFTRFGKLEANSKLSFSFIPSISNKIGWIIFYTFSCIMFFASFIIRYPPSLGNYLLVVHSFRRLLESLLITKFSDRKMHLVNLCAGLMFYAMAPITISYCATPNSGNSFLLCSALVLNFLQFIIHKELSSLRKYSIPKGFMFTKLAAPHYTVEIILYLIYFACAPHYLTLCMFIFVAFNLTHQSVMTYSWYQNKFGTEFASLGRYRVIPWLY